jgi:lipopolysaccharide/colanic/teichoic acid biosynthesis glycosyltransferase
MLPDADQIMRIGIDCCVHGRDAEAVLQALRKQATCRTFDGLAALEASLQTETMLSIPEILLLEVDPAGQCFEMVERLRKNVLLSGLIIVMLAPDADSANGERARALRIHDYYESPYPVADIGERMTFLVKYKLLRPRIADLLSQELVDSDLRMPVWKRAFDVAFSLGLLLLLSPLMLLIALFISLESRGPVVYHSKRVGSGYKVFNFYKFRSMFPDADSRLAEFMSSNQYAADSGSAGVFVKLKNDPRITRVGRIIRKLSIDELPQLFNILRGDMSTVGNRPLPLYEAEQLTSNEWSLRFLAPSGLTGLWQISRRGRADMSERERKKLDNFYAKNYSLLFDLKILLKTLPAAFQRENV